MPGIVGAWRVPVLIVAIYVQASGEYIMAHVLRQMTHTLPQHACTFIPTRSLAAERMQDPTIAKQTITASKIMAKMWAADTPYLAAL